MGWILLGASKDQFIEFIDKKNGFILEERIYL